MLQLGCVKEVHDFHLWAISDEKPIFTAHVVYVGDSNHALFRITELLQKEYKIFQSTIQLEPMKESHFAQKKQGLLPCLNEHRF